MITHRRFSVGAKNHPIQENGIEIVALIVEGDDRVEKLLRDCVVVVACAEKPIEKAICVLFSTAPRQMTATVSVATSAVKMVLFA